MYVPLNQFIYVALMLRPPLAVLSFGFELRCASLSLLVLMSTILRIRTQCHHDARLLGCHRLVVPSHILCHGYVSLVLVYVVVLFFPETGGYVPIFPFRHLRGVPSKADCLQSDYMVVGDCAYGLLARYFDRTA